MRVYVHLSIEQVVLPLPFRLPSCLFDRFGLCDNKRDWRRKEDETEILYETRAHLKENRQQQTAKQQQLNGQRKNLDKIIICFPNTLNSWMIEIAKTQIRNCHPSMKDAHTHTPKHIQRKMLHECKICAATLTLFLSFVPSILFLTGTLLYRKVCEDHMNGECVKCIETVCKTSKLSPLFRDGFRFFCPIQNSVL